MVALSLVWIVGLASLVVDIGGGWLSRQSLIPATDAAALAAAQDLVDEPWNENGACATAASYVAANVPDATMTGCDITSFGNGGRVTITATDDLETNFTGPDVEDIAVQSISSAAWGAPSTVIGLRPLALCYDGSSALQDLIDNPPSGPSYVVVDYLKDDPSDCGGPSSAGNFATLDFVGGATIQELRNWTLNGYPGQIGFDPITVVDCDGGAICYDRPYASIDIIGELRSLQYSQAYVAIPVFNYTDVDFVHLIGMVRARIYDFDFSGSASDQWISFYVEPGLIIGTCCGQPGVQSGNQVIAICGVDANAFEACEPSS